MKFFKFLFFLFLTFVSFCFVSSSFEEVELINLLDLDGKKLFKNIFISLGNENTSNVIELLKNKDSNDIVLNTLDYNEEELLVYLYNTHNREEYKETVYGIVPSVMDVSNMLQSELLKYYVYSYVEDMDIIKEVNKRNLEYYESYDLTRSNMINIKKEYPSIKYFFDIHRDSVKGDLSRVKIDDKNYAKFMFLVGKKNSNYKENEKNIKKMSDYINKKYPGILRNTYYNNYIYNQDLSKNAFLIEVGGVDNTIEELYNTSVVIADMINYLIGEQI